MRALGATAADVAAAAEQLPLLELDADRVRAAVQARTEL